MHFITGLEIEAVLLIEDVYPTHAGLWVKSRLFLARYRTSRLPRNRYRNETTDRSAPLQGRCTCSLWVFR